MTEDRGEELDAPPRSVDEPLRPVEGGLLVRHEEEIVGAHADGWRGVGLVTARKRSDRSKVDLTVSRVVESAGLERIPVEEGDSQAIETLPDGSISIPLFEEEIVVTKRVVLRERVILRKNVETVTQRIVDELRRERIEIDVDEALRDRVRLRDDET